MYWFRMWAKRRVGLGVETLHVLAAFTVWRTGMSIGKSKWSRGILLSLVMGLLAVLPTVALAQAPSVDELRQAAEQNPENANIWIDLGNALYNESDYETAKEAFLEAIALDYQACDAHYGLGLSEFARGDFQAGLFAFNEVTRLCEQRFDGHYNRGVTLARLRRAADAAEAFREALAQAEPEAGTQDRINALRGLATQLKEAGQYAEAADAYGQALEFRPDDATLSFLRAEALYLAGEGLDALPILTELEQDSSDYRVNALIADIYTDQGQIDYALRSLERALRKAETADNLEAQADILVKLGLLQRDLGRDAEAASSFRRAAEADPTSWEAAYNLGVSLLESGQTRSALDPLRQAVELQPSNGQVQLALATAFDQLAQPGEAMEAAREAASTLQDAELLARARFILGRSLYQQGDFAAAAMELQQVVESMPNSAQAQLWAGLAEYQRGNYRQAALLYERASQLDPASIEARVNLGAAYLASERFQDAERVYRSLVEQNARDAESYYNLGWSLLAQERRGAARDGWGTSCDLGYQPACDALSRYF